MTYRFKYKKLSYHRDSGRRPPNNTYCQKLESMGYIFLAGGMGLGVVNLTQFVPKAAILCENNA